MREREAETQAGGEAGSTQEPDAPHAAPIRKPIILRCVWLAQSEEHILSVHTHQRSIRIEPAGENLFMICSSIHVTPTTTLVLYPLSVESNSREEDLDTRNLEMSEKTANLSCFGFEGLLRSEDLARLSPVVCSKLTEILKSELDEWTVAMNAEFEAAEQPDVVVK
ncbi:unnamed protein product [Nyctereutes procyonoides]|uniref:(raccoon dog) hypothetical protein n=1 Tax=Nyctereutes procyonoides TaxID=34880 RepID=A0A811YPE1_NYCPR|nr:unnamed protein product [Nyctereutes procyonoides]